ncbi:MAG: PHB depolymerase family esterase [Sandaracinaceae bacterium]
MRLPWFDLFSRGALRCRVCVSVLLAMVPVACGGATDSDGGMAPDAGPSDAAAAIDAGRADGGPNDAGSPVDAGPVDAGPVDAGPIDAGGAACVPSLAPGDSTRTVSFGGATRSFLVHVPVGHGPEAAALVIDLHGFTENPDRQDGRSGMRAAADRGGFVVVQPEGVSASWNGGACCGSAARDDLDDVGLMRAIVADVSAVSCIDPDRVFATGMSNGGFLAHRIACEAADLFAAIAPVAGVMGIDLDDCTPSRPISVFHTHGRNDLVVPYSGNGFISYPSVEATMDRWVALNGCTSSSTEDIESAECETWTGCTAGVETRLCTVSGQGHSWPDGRFPATEQIVAFFARHRRP